MTRPCPHCGVGHGRLRYLEAGLRVVRCLGCGLVYLANPPEIVSLYEEYHLPLQQVEPQLLTINTRRIACVRRWRSSGRLLDVGCGIGLFLDSARSAGYDVFGIDVAARAIELCRNRGLQVEVATLDDLLERDLRFDIITLWHVLEHFLDPFDELVKIRRLLAPRGLCLIEVPNLNSIKFMLSRRKWTGGNSPLYHRTFFTRTTLAQAIRESGFSGVRRLRLSYGATALIRAGKRIFNVAALDSFLTFIAFA